MRFIGVQYIRTWSHQRHEVRLGTPTLSQSLALQRATWLGSTHMTQACYLRTVTAAVHIEMHSCTVQYNSDPFSVTYTCMLGYNTHTVTMGVHCWQRNQISIVVSFVIICTVRLCTHTCTVYRRSFSHIHIHTYAASPPNYHTNST